MIERRANPYRPGFNQAPLVLAGREALLRDAEEAVEIAALDGRTPRPLILIGPRGVGKTVTLGEIAAVAAERHAWPSMHVEATGDGRLVESVADRLLQAALLLEGEQPRQTAGRTRTRVTGGKVSAAGFGVGAEVRLERDAVASPSDLPDALRRAMEAAVARDAGVILTIDELQTASTVEVGGLAATLQEAVPQQWPLVVVMAGLPSLRNTRGRRRAPTYLERAEWHELGMLDTEAARRALIGPADQAGRPMTRPAADLLLEIAGGYPYAVQVAGHFAWRASSGADTITRAHARAAVARIEQDLNQLFAGRWDDASQREREYLRAMALLEADGRSVTSGAVAAHLRLTTPQLSYLRDRLMKKGTIYPSPDGSMRFITPGMGQWISRSRGLARW